mgnify:CR=1 FL=1
MDKIINDEPDLETIPDSNSIQFLEHMYEAFLVNPKSLDPYWSSYFEKFSDQLINALNQKAQIRPSWARQDWPPLDSGEEIAAFDGQWQRVQSNLIESDDNKTAKEKELQEKLQKKKAKGQKIKILKDW